MAEFRCKPGECVECCTNDKMSIPVTLPDLYRACVYAKHAKGVSMTLAMAYDRLCDGWMYMPDPQDLSWPLPCPKSIIPCPHVDAEQKRCRIHDTTQYIACKHYPEGMLIKAVAGCDDNEESKNFWKSLPCMKDVSLTPEREKALKDMCDAASREVMLTGRLLNNRMQPITARNTKDFEAELRMRLGYISKPEGLIQFFQNMMMNNTQKRYMSLFGTRECPDYTIDPIGAGLIPRSWAMGDMSDVIGKVARNDPCPCGSQKKFKKCCGGH